MRHNGDGSKKFFGVTVSMKLRATFEISQQLQDLKTKNILHEIVSFSYMSKALVISPRQPPPNLSRSGRKHSPWLSRYTVSAEESDSSGLS